MRKGDNDTNHLVICSIFFRFSWLLFFKDVFSQAWGCTCKILTFEAGDSGFQYLSYLMSFSVTCPLKTCNNACFLT